MVKKLFTTIVLTAACILCAQAQPPQGTPQTTPQPAAQTGRQWNQDVDRSLNNLTLDMYFTPVVSAAAVPDEEGFIRRWSLLEPIDKPNRSNTVFVDSYLREAFGTEYFKGQMDIIPKDGEKVSLDKKTKLAWHWFDSKLYNVKLFRFASELDKQVYGVLFWAVTVVNCEKDIEDVRMLVGSNSASMWWLNGEEVLLMSGDRRMVADDCATKRLTLKKGKNVIRGAVINGPGMSDFCVRFVDGNGKPVRGITITNN